MQRIRQATALWVVRVTRSKSGFQARDTAGTLYFVNAPNASELRPGDRVEVILNLAVESIEVPAPGMTGCVTMAALATIKQPRLSTLRRG